MHPSFMIFSCRTATSIFAALSPVMATTLGLLDFLSQLAFISIVDSDCDIVILCDTSSPITGYGYF